ncbi:hypothetical protein FB45DRAFT_864704 [Roridomyces roridus]|uniref:Uncharacterized protein n=1 Tax=Roridomyces roridus TaxID=1738132 RepID=A0AAD7C202_9AGAR|nr:hypothetical protein FB45DRAFT_864704 [Roridomyces roridus]
MRRRYSRIPPTPRHSPALPPSVVSGLLSTAHSHCCSAPTLCTSRQRTKLEKQWHADFPALHTEGGLPGSESAGIVAFIRERLIDVGETLPDGDHDPSKSAVDHLESLRSTPEVRTSLMVEESGVIPREDEDEESKVQGIPLSEKNLTWRMCDVRAEIV